MSRTTIIRMALCFNNNTNTDKVWGVGVTDDARVFRFWGRRGRTPVVKFGTREEIMSTWYEKIDGEYVEVTHNHKFSHIVKQTTELLKRR